VVDSGVGRKAALFKRAYHHRPGQFSHGGNLEVIRRAIGDKAAGVPHASIHQCVIQVILQMNGGSSLNVSRGETSPTLSLMEVWDVVGSFPQS
jgi:hypothetical protein